MTGLSKEDYLLFHERTGAASKAQVLEARTDRDPSFLNVFERKQEFYGLLKSVASPGIVTQVQLLQRRFPLGLVRRVSEDSPMAESSLDEVFAQEVAQARLKQDALEVANVVYRIMRPTLEIAGHLWHEEMVESDNLDFQRMNELMEPETVSKYGERALSKRVASATAQTASVGLGMQELALRMYRKKFKRKPSVAQLIQSHTSALRIAMLWADFNRHQLVGLEKHIRTLRSDHDGIEPLHLENAFEIQEDGSLSFVGAHVLDMVSAEKPETKEGRFGCPGKRYIPILWQWTQDVSAEHGIIKMIEEL